MLQEFNKIINHIQSPTAGVGSLWLLSHSGSSLLFGGPNNFVDRALVYYMHQISCMNTYLKHQNNVIAFKDCFKKFLGFGNVNIQLTKNYIPFVSSCN